MTVTQVVLSRPVPNDADRSLDVLDGATGRLGPALVPLASRPDALPGRFLLEPGGIGIILAPLRRAMPGAGDRPLLSLWSRHLFLAAIPPILLTLLLSHRRLPLRPEGTGVVLNEAGLPVAVALPHAGVPAIPSPAIADRLAPLFRDYLGPVVEGLATSGRLAPRILWGNVAHYLDWAARSLPPEVPPPLSAGLADLLGSPDWPDGRRNPVHGLIGRTPGGDPRRAVCCLLLHLPERKTCRGCPVAMRRTTRETPC